MFTPFSYYLFKNDDLETQIDRCKKHTFSLLAGIADGKKREEMRKYFEGFMNLYSNFLKSSPIEWDKVKPVPKERMKYYNDLSDIHPDDIPELLKKLVVIKLNGGLGTTMGCSFPKSLIIVRNGMNFLDLNVMQLAEINSTYNSDVPLVLMNSFYTEKDTIKILEKYSMVNVKIHTFCQSHYPRISGNTFLPIVTQDTLLEESCWYPPGHGNFFESFQESGLLDKFLDEGRTILFVSNIDNLGAVVDLKLLQCMVSPKPEGTRIDFMMEVTEKTKADVKGGTLIEQNNKVRLLEIAQVPNEHIDEFKSVSKFKVFNTNNIWLNIENLKKQINENPLNLDVITNRKVLKDGSEIIQLETAIGAAIMNFDNSMGMVVPRSRFLPVKNISDLFLVMSNLYIIKSNRLIMNPKRNFMNTPIIQFSGPFFKNVNEFFKRFPNIPDILELDYLAVSGDVCFGKDVSLKGTVIILAQHGDHIDIPRGSSLENKIISGNLRIVDH